MKNFLTLWKNCKTLPLDVLLRDCPWMAYSIDRKGYLINVSTVVADELGYKPAEMIGTPSVDFLTPQSRLAAKTRYLPEFWKTGELRNVPYTYVRSNGDPMPVHMTAIAIGESGKFKRSLAMLTPRDDGPLLAQVKADLIHALAQAEAHGDPAVSYAVVRDAVQDFLSDS